METNVQTTKERILDTAERLFADKGFGETSLRDITTEAGTNLAAVNYHFQSKEALILAVCARRVGPVNEIRLKNLDELEAKAGGAPVPIEELLRAHIAPLLVLLTAPHGANAGRLMGRMFVEPGALFERFFREQMTTVADRFFAALRLSVPHIPEAEIYWRMVFAMGAVAHTVAGLHKIRVISGGLCDPSDIEALEDQLIAFLIGGLQAPAAVALKGEVPCSDSH